MEQERIARENEEKERADRMKKIKDQFDDPNSQWEKDKTDIQNEALKEKKEKEESSGNGAAAAKADDSKAGEAKPNELPKVWVMCPFSLSILLIYSGTVGALVQGVEREFCLIITTYRLSAGPTDEFTRTI